MIELNKCCQQYVWSLKSKHHRLHVQNEPSEKYKQGMFLSRRGNFIIGNAKSFLHTPVTLKSRKGQLLIS